MHLLKCVLGCYLTLSLFPLILHAEENPSIAEVAYSNMRTEVFALADRVDNYFGDVRSELDRNSDFFKLGEEVRFRAASAVRFRQRVSLSIKLDSVSQKLRLVAEGEDSELRKDGDKITDTQQGDDYLKDFNNNGSTLGLRYNLLEGDTTNLDITNGFRFSGGPDPFSKIKISKKININENWSYEPSEQLMWYLNDGFGERSRVDFIRSLSPQKIFRTRSEALWSETSKGLNIFQEIALLEELSERSSRGLSLSLVAFTSPGAVDEFSASYRYRSSFLFPWLYGEFKPALIFPDDRSYRATPELSLKIEVYFDRLPRTSIN